MATEDQKCVFLWAVPRSLSTALTKCMSFVDGVQIWHEPYQYTYHKEKFAAMATSTDPADQFILQAMASQGSQQAILQSPKGKLIDEEFFGYPWLKEQLETKDKDKKLIFVKDIGFLVHGKFDFLPTERKYRHTFLIRDPHRVYMSLRKLYVDNTPEEFKLGDPDLRKFPLYEAHRIFQYNYDLWKYVKENLDSEPIILDATELSAHPEKLLPKYFDALDIPWKEDYLTFDSPNDVTTEWKASLQGFLTAKAAMTHKIALESKRFIPDVAGLPSREEMTEDVIECVDDAMPFYKEMYEQRIKP